MKLNYFPFLLFSIIVFWGCNSQKKSSEIATYQYEEESIDMSDEFRKVVPEWVKAGKICYGLIEQINDDGIVIKGKPVKAKVVQISRNHVKMKALERVSMAKDPTCNKMGLMKGEIWEEKTGDFYLTKEEAVNVLKEKNIYFDRATVD